MPVKQKQTSSSSAGTSNPVEQQKPATEQSGKSTHKAQFLVTHYETHSESNTSGEVESDFGGVRNHTHV